MKNIKILSLFLLLASAQIYGVANPELRFILAYQAIDSLGKAVSIDLDDMAAQQLIQAMNYSIDFDIAQKQQLAAVQGSFWARGVALDASQLQQQNTDLQQQINNLEKEIE